MTMPPVIICVDDEEMVLSALSKELRNMLDNSYTIEVADSGMETLQLIDDLLNEGRDIALIISDFTMPGMNGGELLEKASIKLPNTAKILLTGHAEMQDISKTLNKSKLDKLLLKPWKSYELANSITETLLTWQLKKDLQLHQTKASERNVALELIAQVAKTGSFIWQPETNKINFSAQWLNTFGHTNTGDMQWYLSLVHANDIEMVKERFAQLSNGSSQGHKIEFRIKDGNGAWRWIINNSSVSKYSNTNHQRNIICIEQDISEYKYKEELLLHADQINEILRHVSEQIIFIAADGKVIWANRHEDGTNCSDTNFTCYEKWGHANRCDNCPVVKSLKTGENCFAEVKTDTGKIYATTSTPVKNDQGQVLGIVHSRLDITKQKELEMKLQHNQKMESVGQLAAGIAHELNTPIQYISDNLNFLKRSFDTIQEKLTAQVDMINNNLTDTQQIGDFLSNMFNEDFELKEAPNAFADALYGTSHIAKIVSAMKDFTHPDGNGPELSDINNIVSNAVTISKNEWKYVAEVNTSLTEDAINITCMPGSLLQVIINMLVNSAHAIEERQKNDNSPGLINITTSKDEQYAIVKISDNGNGIPESITNKIFDPFFTTKEVGKGTGQGLAITHDIIINKHKGKIDLETVHGKGTTFTLWLPLTFKGQAEDHHQKHAVEDKLF